ncbi:aminotransferase class I and II [Microbacterium sp. ARD31]|uniref:HipA family kinase n=1 Tax=Microbacterium sp. ARD31 TaxID=2962576 RepID=UPI002880E92C|nr:HipA family kinase [Microbacterium sp. ARD31]MDT0187806.1 aminotransferase class I and II [Microbacterium sp. ARD31]
MTSTALPLVTVTRYVTPLREGGSLPGVVEGDDLGTYVCKFRGAGQGAKVLVAEVVVSELATRLGLRTPRLVVLDLDPELARYEADEEVQDLLNASAGRNLGIDFLPGAFGVDGQVSAADDEGARVLWLDAFTANVDRSWRNPNLLVWHGDLWVIDHGASLYFHHGWRSGPTDPAKFAAQPWDVSGHVFESCADRTRELDAEISAVLDREVFTEVLAAVPDVWLEPVPDADGGEPLGPDALRAAYVDFLDARLGTRQWLPGGPQ